MSIDTSKFYNENGTLLANKLGNYLIELLNLIHVQEDATQDSIEALETPIYAYNDKFGIYKGLTHKGDTAISNIIYGIIPDISNNKRNETIKYIKAMAPIKTKDKRNLIAFNNCLMDIATFEQVPKSSDIVSTSAMLHLVYDKSKKNHSLLDTFMNNLFEDDAELHRLAYEMIGYGFADTNFMGKFFILVGEGGNGKSSFLDLIKALYGNKNVSYVALADIDGNKFRLAEMYGKIINIGDDIERGAIQYSANLKKLVTGETVQCEYKGQNPFNFKSRVKLFFSANDAPRLCDTSQGMLDRVVVVPFTKRIRGTGTASPNIVKAIAESGGLSVLLNRSLEGLARLQNTNTFTVPKIVQEATDKYNRQNNHILEFLQAIEEGEIVQGGAFLHDTCFTTMGTPYVLENNSRAATYQTYRKWSYDSGYTPKSRSVFESDLERLGYEKSKPKKINGHTIRAWEKAEKTVYDFIGE